MGDNNDSDYLFATQGKIHIISTCSVEAEEAEAEANEIIHFTPFDAQFLSLQYAQRGLLFPNPPQSSSILPRLKSSLSRALSIFPPFAARLAAVHYDDGTASFSIRCNSSSGGALLVHAIADGLASSDILRPDSAPPGLLTPFFPMNGAYGFQGVSDPLLAVQLTELIDGVFMGITFSHAVADGSSFWHFLNTWSEISRGCKSVAELDNPAPVIGHWFLHGMGIGIDPPIRFPFSFEETISSPKSQTPTPLPLPLLQRVFHFSKDKIAQLKAKSNSELNPDTVTISSLQSILAHIWRAVIRNRRDLDPEEEVHCKLLVNFRQRLRPKLPDAYFGNVVLFGTATARVGELLGEGIGYAGMKLNETVERQTDGEARRWLREWMEGGKAAAMMPKLGAMARKSLIVADSPRFDVYGNDFGWGKPVAVRAAGNYSDGKVTVLAGKEEGSVDVQLCLGAETMGGIENDSEFMEFVG